MKNKKGFTLVELLAVIVILAVVILIAVTAVIPRMNKARENAFIDEALVYYKAAKEAYINDSSTECYNISDFGNYVKNDKSDYSGTIYVNENGVSLNLTNGTYYMKTDSQPTSYFLKKTKPDKFVDSCSDSSKSYTISYDLGGGTVVTANPTSYTANTATFTLNNPTKSGYRFVGWSSKNLVDLYGREKGDITYGTCTDARNFELNKFYVSLAYNNCAYTNVSGYNGSENSWRVTGTVSGYGIAFPIRVKPNTSYSVSYNSDGAIDVGYYTSGSVKISGQAYSSKNYVITTPQNCEILTVILRPKSINSENKFDDEYSNVQIEESGSVTDYQEFMEPTITAKVYRGSTGNKKFIANWEAI